MSKKQEKEKNQHIQVFVRCRPLNSKEKKQGGYGVVEVGDREVHVKDRSATTAPTKTFSFDKVYGPHSKQIDVHKQVVSPLVEEVLSGYNCTVFAYGQTGTGKTFTMEGERTENRSVSWEDDPLAGIIPRAMHQLFTRLTLMGCEFSVRVSFLEIYNEELIDLLGAESVENPRLRIYEDSARKGSCIIQGLEEVVVRDKDEVYKIMDMGSARRQTAATLMNAHSSRSHSLFMVTVHIKENSVDGEEMLKTGKLNLVDLAGSECIGRSGASDKRAREAGNINQSLLTLGRVITALVEHAPHVPYRESKLTRLLQDSLGGRTKTSIIATISPASLNLDETLSTLDYAFRAKNITNRPEINQRLSKKTLLKEYNEEIERLRRDLQAARDKNGVYLAQDNYDEMQTRIQQQRDSIVDLTDRIALLTGEMIKVSEMFDATKEELMMTESELTDTKVDLGNTRDVLDKTRHSYQLTIQDRDEQRHLVSKHVKAEGQLSSEASQLLTTADDATTDVSGLHAKLHRKLKVDDHNESAIENFRLSFRENIDRTKENLKQFTEEQVSRTSSMKTSTGSVEARRAEEVTALSSALGHMVETLTERLTLLDDHQAARLADNRKWAADLCATCQQTKDNEVTRQDDFKERTFLTSMMDIQNSLTVHLESLQKLDELRNSQVETQQAEFAKFAEDMESRLRMQADLAETLTDSVKHSLSQHQQQVQEMVDSKKALDKTLKEKLVSQMEALIQETLTSQDADLDTHAQRLHASQTSVSSTAQLFGTSSETQLQDALSANHQGLDAARRMTSQHNADAHDVIKQQSAELQRIIEKQEAMKSDVSQFTQQTVTNYSNQTRLVVEKVELHAASLCEAHTTHTQGTQAATMECSSSVSELAERQVGEHTVLSADLGSLQQQLASLQTAASEWSENMARDLDGHDEQVEKLLTEDFRKDLPTGSTPQVRDFSYPKKLTRTDRHSFILQDFRRNYVRPEVADLRLSNSSFESVLGIGPLDLDADIDDQNISQDSAISSTSSFSTSTNGEHAELDDVTTKSNCENKENKMKPPKAVNVPKSSSRGTQDRPRSRSRSSRDNSLSRKTPQKTANPAVGAKTPTSQPAPRQSRTRLPLRANNTAN